VAGTADLGRVLTIALVGAAFACGGERRTQAAADASASTQDGNVAAPEAGDANRSADGDSSGGAGDAAPDEDASPRTCGEIDAACGSCCMGLTCYGGRCCETYGPCDSGSVCCEPLAACILGHCVIHPQ
jgi:hypothetical protein